MATETPILKPLTPGDLAAACRLSDEAAWNQTAHDWLMMLARGHAAGLFEADGTLVATTLVLPYEARVGWISMVLVARAQRRRGLATRLLRHALAHTEQAGLLPLLDATEAGRKVYERMGFRDLYTLSRWHRPPAPNTAVRAASEAHPPRRPLTVADLDALAAWDRARFGVSRAPVLAYCRQAAPHLARLAGEAGDDRAGYSLGRPGRRATQFGPLVADDDATARLLLHDALEKTAGAVYVDVPDAQTAFQQTLAEVGFTRQRGFTRMGKGNAVPLPLTPSIFAIAGPDLG